MKIFWTKETHSDIYKDALKIRYKVFVDEQKVPVDLEIDELESMCMHGVIYDSSKAIATIRIYPLKSTEYKIQRVAVLSDYRSKGVGRLLMQEVENKIKRKNNQRLILDSQNKAIPFYKKLGYKISSSEFMDAGIPHHRMTKEI